MPKTLMDSPLSDRLIASAVASQQVRVDREPKPPSVAAICGVIIALLLLLFAAIYSSALTERDRIESSKATGLPIER